MKIGIYKITNKNNGKFYIGSSDQIIDRWDNHRSELRRFVHPNIHLSRAWKKHGEDAFVFEILEECDKEQLLEREQYYLDTLLKAQEYIKTGDTFFLKKGYNILPIASRSSAGLKHTRESMDKMAATKGANQILAVSGTGELLHEFLRAEYVMEFYKMDSSVIYGSIANRRMTKKGVGFIYKKDYVEGYIPAPTKQGGRTGKDQKRNRRAIDVYTLYGEFYKSFRDLHECSEYFKTWPEDIHRKLSTKNIKYLITPKTVSRYVMKDKGFDIDPIKQKWDKIFNSIKNSEGRCKVTDCFGNYIGNTNEELLAELLEMKFRSVYNAISRGTNIRSLKVEICRQKI